MSVYGGKSFSDDSCVKDLCLINVFNSTAKPLKVPLDFRSFLDLPKHSEVLRVNVVVFTPEERVIP